MLSLLLRPINVRFEPSAFGANKLLPAHRILTPLHRFSAMKLYIINKFCYWRIEKKIPKDYFLLLHHLVRLINIFLHNIEGFAASVSASNCISSVIKKNPVSCPSPYAYNNTYLLQICKFVFINAKVSPPCLWHLMWFEENSSFIDVRYPLHCFFFNIYC